MFEIKNGFLKGQNKLKVIFAKTAIGNFKDKETLNERFLQQAEKESIFGMKLALRLGADPNARNEKNFTAIGIAVEKDNLQMVEFLKDIRIADLSAFQGIFKETPLILASIYGFYEIAESLIKSGRVELNAIDLNGKTALMHAASVSNLEIVKLLCHRGARTDIICKDMSAVDWAVYMKLHDPKAEEIKNFLVDLVKRKKIELLDEPPSYLEPFWMRKK